MLPTGTYGRIAPRSGLALNQHIAIGAGQTPHWCIQPVFAGVIDRDYTGNVGIVVFNHSNVEVKITRGQRVAQLICESCCYPQLVEITDEDSRMSFSEEVVRGDRGYGSTDQPSVINPQPSVSRSSEVLTSKAVIDSVIDSVLMTKTWTL